MVTVAAVRGSAPRGVGTRMTVASGGRAGEDEAAEVDESDGAGELHVAGTIGGGALERAALERARELLGAPPAGDGAAADAEAPLIVTERFPLGKALSQCCGGEVTLQFERHPGNDFRVEVFGAGHVAQELARLLVRLPCIATFHDGRTPWLDRLAAIEGAGRLRRERLGVNPHASVETGPANAYWLVMTHSHELDLEVVEAVLSRGDSRYCGLIASRSKAASFRGRLARKGFTDEELSHLTAPLGQRVDTGNTPMEVAIAAAADLLSARTAALAGRSVSDVCDTVADESTGGSRNDVCP